MTLSEAKARIEELEKENAELKKELEKFKSMKPLGRKKHDAKWQKSYQTWVEMYESGMNNSEIARNAEFSRRTCYRYKAYYDELNKVKSKKTEK